MRLEEFFAQNNRAALAFSGGVDSAYLLYAGIRSGAVIRAYYVKTRFQPDFEYRDALRLAEELGADITVIEADILEDPVVVSNPPDRCYHCKRRIFGRILEEAEKDGFTLVLDGTNASDDAGDRPGMRALKELMVRSPLRECGLTKAEIRRLSREAGLFTWDKPAYACLATRIPAGCRITSENLQATENAEDFLFSLGFEDFRVRMTNEGGAKLQVPENQLAKVMENRGEILQKLKNDYAYVVLDLETRNGK